MLAPGSRLGPYEIVAPLGAGGMGEVYRARDTRLGRDVAVKVLPEHLSSAPEVRARFEREARAVSSLNHPHICTLHDVGREGETDFLVMELVEGETLAARLERGSLPMSEVLRLGAQIADALDRAHRAGIVHRDLKPANVMLTKSGAKLMDFGLARATGVGGAGSGTSATIAALSQSPTMSRALTAEGTIVGTFLYMSPEQLEGSEADARSDLWALGCVLYEMATGRHAFEGKSQASLIGAIMHAEPAPIAAVMPMSPPALERLVGACLAKDPADRVQSAHDVKLQLAWMAEGALAASSAGAAAIAPALPARPRSRAIPTALVALASAAAAALVTAIVLRGDPTSRDAGALQRYGLGSADLLPSSTPMFTPDGAAVVFSVRDGATRHIYRRSLSAFEMEPIPGTEDGSGPFFSPDGVWLGFITPAAIKKVPIDGGVAQTILTESRVDAADWGEDGNIYYTARAGGADGLTALARVPETGGRAEVVAALDTTAGDSETWLPEILPGGKAVLVTVNGAFPSQWRVVALNLDGSRHVVVEGALLSRYSPSGHLLYYDFNSQAALAAPFDPAKAQITGPAVPLTEQIAFTNCFDVSKDGRLVYVPLGGASEGDEVVWLDRNGAATPAFGTRGPWTQPRVSPDGARLLVRKTGTDCELWIYDVERATMSRVAQGSDNHDPIWSPDGRRVAFQKADARGEMVALTVEGARAVTTIAQGAGTASPQSWSAAGNRLVYTQTGRATQSDIWLVEVDGAARPEPFVATEFHEIDPAISPDGRWIAYGSNEGGAQEVFVRAYPDQGTAWQISAGGGASPLWSRDGRELFFVAGTKMMAVRVETTPALRIGTPIELFDGGFSTARTRDYDVSPDGRFLAVRHTGGAAGLELRVVLNWPAELARRRGAVH